MEITKDNRTWLDNLGLPHPVVIAGPCSAETEEQVLKTAHELKTPTPTFLEPVFGNLERVLVDLKASEKKVYLGCKECAKKPD